MFQTQIVDVTPEMAREWLGKNSNNRQPSQRYIATLCRDMKSGNWHLDGNSIKFNCDGQLLDGQHRLMACVSASVSFTTLVALGVDKSAMQSLDCGRKRTFGDVLKIAGTSNHKNLAAVARIIFAYERGDIGRIEPSTHAELSLVMENHPDLFESVIYCKNKRNAGGVPLLPLPLSSALHYLFSDLDDSLADTYIGALLSGIDTGSVGVYPAVSRYLASRVRIYGGAAHKEQVYGVIRGWNALRRGEKIQLLRYCPGQTQTII